MMRDVSLSHDRHIAEVEASTRAAQSEVLADTEVKRLADVASVLRLENEALTRRLVQHETSKLEEATALSRITHQLEEAHHQEVRDLRKNLELTTLQLQEARVMRQNDSQTSVARTHFQQVGSRNRLALALRLNTMRMSATRIWEGWRRVAGERRLRQASQGHMVEVQTKVHKIRQVSEQLAVRNQDLMREVSWLKSTLALETAKHRDIGDAQVAPSEASLPFVSPSRSAQDHSTMTESHPKDSPPHQPGASAVIPAAAIADATRAAAAPGAGDGLDEVAYLRALVTAMNQKQQESSGIMAEARDQIREVTAELRRAKQRESDSVARSEKLSAQLAKEMATVASLKAEVVSLLGKGESGVHRAHPDLTQADDVEPQHHGTPPPRVNEQAGAASSGSRSRQTPRLSGSYSDPAASALPRSVLVSELVKMYRSAASSGGHAVPPPFSTTMSNDIHAAAIASEPLEPRLKQLLARALTDDEKRHFGLSWTGAAAAASLL